jgi:hypothetical protein
MKGSTRIKTKDKYLEKEWKVVPKWKTEKQ